MKINNLLVIIPAFNEAPVVESTINGLWRIVPRNSQILVIDDASNDNTGAIARRSGAIVIRHPINRGLGGALGTGFYWAKAHDIQCAVTFDADGQHNPKDLFRVLSPLLKDQADVVIGSRTGTGWKNIPWDRKIIIITSNFLTWWFFGTRTSDSLSGFRAFNRKAIEKIQIRTDHMEVSNEFFAEIQRNRLRLAEVYIHVIYSSYSRSKGQRNSNALDVTAKMLLRLAR